MIKNRKKPTAKQTAHYYASNPHINIMRGGGPAEIEATLERRKAEGQITRNPEEQDLSKQDLGIDEKRLHRHESPDSGDHNFFADEDELDKDSDC